MNKGPLSGYRVIELAGLGPNPMAGMLLADLGADVVVVDRGKDTSDKRFKDVSFRGKRSVILNLKDPQDLDVLLAMVEKADVLTEGFRPGVAERLGFGSDVCLARNPRLVYARMTGWGQTGPLAHTAGHDINYISLTGSLHAIGLAGEKPVPPLNLIDDMGGGGMVQVAGILAALLECQKSGKGQVIDAAMTDGSALLMWMAHSDHAMNNWDPANRGVNWLDGGAPYYDVYETADGKYVSIGAIEPQFYALLMGMTGVDKQKFTALKEDKSQWPALKNELQLVFKSKTQAQWRDLMEGTDVCFAPVLSFAEAPKHPHNLARQTYIDVDGVVQPAPAPRFSRTPAQIRHGARQAGFEAEVVLREYGISEQTISRIMTTSKR
ncbi:MAG: CoA transferase [Porticoccaceae bacterium]|nr:CoA transferase [Porticoccaceae bacterium]